MKFLIVLVTLALLASALADPIQLTEEQKAKVRQYAEQCKTETGATDDDATKLRNKDFTDPSDKQKCFINCFFEKAGTIKDGAVQPEVIQQKLGPMIGEDNAKAVMDKCNGVKGADNCDTAFKVYECFENAKAELMI